MRYIGGFVNNKRSGLRYYRSLIKYNIFLLLFLFLFLDCVNKTGKYTYHSYKKLKSSQNIVKLSSSLLNKNELSFPSAFLVLYDYLILIDSKGEKLIHIYDIKSNSLLGSFGTLGQGPGEFIGPSQVIQDKDDPGSFWIYDVSTRSVKKFNVNKVLKGNIYPDNIIQLSSECGTTTSLAFASDNKIFGVGIYYKGRIAIFDASGRFIKSVGDLPILLKDEKYSFYNSHAFNGGFIIKNKSKELFIAPRLSSVIEIYSIEGGLVETLIGPTSFYPEYSIVPAGHSYTMAYNKNTRHGFVDIQYSEALDRLFVLYSGNYQFNKNKINAILGKTIYVLDNKNTIVEDIELDTPIAQMRISNNGLIIYGFTESEVRIFKYK